MKKQIAVWLLAMAALPAWASLNVFATVPEWGALAKEIGLGAKGRGGGRKPAARGRTKAK